jgi:hypothetical protein
MAIQPQGQSDIAEVASKTTPPLSAGRPVRTQQILQTTGFSLAAFGTSPNPESGFCQYFEN